MRAKRKWTAAEDRMIRLQPSGKYTVNQLEKLFRCNRKSMHRRALELGVTLSTQPKHEEHIEIAIEPGSNPYHVGKDRLLMRLRHEHGDRINGIGSGY